MVTHPEATHHVDRRVGGWFDSELTDLDTVQARRVGQALAERVTFVSNRSVVSLNDVAHLDD